LEINAKKFRIIKNETTSEWIEYHNEHSTIINENEIQHQIHQFSRVGPLMLFYISEKAVENSSSISDISTPPPPQSNSIPQYPVTHEKRLYPVGIERYNYQNTCFMYKKNWHYFFY